MSVPSKIHTICPVAENRCIQSNQVTECVKQKGDLHTTVATKGRIEVFKYNKSNGYNGDTKNGEGKFGYRGELTQDYKKRGD